MENEVSAEALFGEEYAGFELHTFAVKNGRGYYVTEAVDNTRTTYPLSHIIIFFDDNTIERVIAESEQELKLWTEHLG